MTDFTYSQTQGSGSSGSSHTAFEDQDFSAYDHAIVIVGAAFDSPPSVNASPPVLTPSDEAYSLLGQVNVIKTNLQGSVILSVLATFRKDDPTDDETFTISSNYAGRFSSSKILVTA